MNMAANSVHLISGGNIIKQGDETPFRFQLNDENGNPVILDGASVILRLANSRIIILEKEVSVEDNSIVFNIEEDEATGHGVMRMEFVVTHSDSSVEIFPARDYQELTIVPSLDSLDSGYIAVITIEEFERRINQAVDRADTAVDSVTEAGEFAQTEGQNAKDNEVIRQGNESTRQSNELQRQAIKDQMAFIVNNFDSEGGYQVDALYSKHNHVEYQGSTWVALQESQGVMPSEGEFWTLVAKRGDVGPKGETGDIGPEGPQGEKGDQGIQGVEGPRGLKGDTGEQGIQGIQGEQGPIGPEGPKGEIGETGAGVTIRGELTNPSELPEVGEPGDGWMIDGHLWVWTSVSWEDVGDIKGPKGETGDIGPQGEQGPQGIQGEIGPEGPQGDTGDIGPKGEVGEKGEKGNPGQDGPQGIEGPEGPQGEQGPRGLQGPEGPKGEDGYTPVKGVDYFDGEKGPQGDVGPQGIQGDTGPKGEDAHIDTSTFATKQEVATHLADDASQDNVHGLREESLSLGSDAESGASSVALGKNAKALGSSTAALGNGASARSNFSIALGLFADTSSQYTVAIGDRADAAGSASLALGRNTSTQGVQSVALGTYAQALNANEGILGGGAAGMTTAWKVPGDFTVNGTKNFEIPHPKPEKKATHRIRHGVVESPTAGDTLYRYTIVATKEHDLQTIDLPDYFIHLNKEVQIFVTPQGHFGNGYGILNRETEQLEIHCQYAGEYNVLVIGTRNDDHPSVQEWDIKGVEREIGESWTGETHVFSVDEIMEVEEIKEESA